MQTSVSLKEKINAALENTFFRNPAVSTTTPQGRPFTQSTVASVDENKVFLTDANNDVKTRPIRRDVFLNTLSAPQQVDILKWAEQQHIKPEDPLWLLVDLMGYTKLMTEALPKKISVAGQQIIETIALQRKLEADAFINNSHKMLGQMLDGLTAQVAQSVENITEVRLRKKLLCFGLLVSGGILLLAACCFIFGYMFGGADFKWIEQYSHNKYARIVQVIFGLPIGYLIMPLLLSGALSILINELAKLRRQRQHR